MWFRKRKTNCIKHEIVYNAPAITEFEQTKLDKEQEWFASAHIYTAKNVKWITFTVEQWDDLEQSPENLIQIANYLFDIGRNLRLKAKKLQQQSKGEQSE